MAKERKLAYEQVKTLFNGSTQKTGKEYVSALFEIFGGTNKNDRPFSVEDIKRQPLLKDFKFEGVKDYVYICQLKATPITLLADGWKNEKILPQNFASDKTREIFIKSQGISYILTCVADGNEHIVKIGASRKTFRERLGSYNCGVVNNWRTASTTNIKILQSFNACAIPFNLYIYDCGETDYYTIWGIKSVAFASSKYLAAEDIMIKRFKELFDAIPLANIQSNADN